MKGLEEHSPKDLVALRFGDKEFPKALNIAIGGKVRYAVAGNNTIIVPITEKKLFKDIGYQQESNVLSMSDLPPQKRATLRNAYFRGR